MTTEQPELDIPAAPLTGERRVPIEDPKLRSTISAMLGLRAAKSILAEEGKFAHGLAGMQVAVNLIDRHYAEIEGDVHRRLVRIMAAAGIDLAAWQAWRFEAGGEAVVCRPITDDLTKADD